MSLPSEKVSYVRLIFLGAILDIVDLIREFVNVCGRKLKETNEKARR